MVLSDNAELAVYPRACGGTPINDRLIQMGEGLSPRLRGNHVAGLL